MSRLRLRLDRASAPRVTLRILAAGAALIVSAHRTSALTTLTWSSGSLLTVINPATVGTGDVLDIVSSNDHDFNATAFINNGTVNWQVRCLPACFASARLRACLSAPLPAHRALARREG